MKSCQIFKTHIKTNYEHYIIKKENCKYDNKCIYYLKNKSKYKYINNTLNLEIVLKV